MPMYAYKGIAASGKNTNGMKDADSPKTLRQILRKEGILVTSFELSKGGKAAKEANAKKGGLSRDVDLGGFFGGVKKTEVAAFTRQMATLLKAGIPLAESLGALVEQVTNIRLKTPLAEVRTNVNEGSSLADALARHPKIFDELFVSMVRAGELAGNLDEVLTRLADFLEGAQKLKSKVQSAMIYPMVMVLVTVGIIGVLMVKVIPEITSMFSQQGKTLPINTRMLIASSGFMGNHWKAILLVMIAGSILFVKWKATKDGKETWHRFVLKIPVVGVLVRTINVSRFARTLGTMLESGVPMLRALDTSKQIVANVVLRDAIENAKRAVTEGESLAQTLKKSGQFPPTMIHMTAVGERAGQLEQMLERVATTYESEVDVKLGRMTALLEPLILVIMGGIVAFIVFSILQPIMDLGNLSGPK
ncbi:MAG: type II secretion system inner membrane protein GspF [Myxococcota bacterium]|nr:type II secretion system inner membrane protein GspF [Deltaproteobacteria bacterium]MDQ3338181.1 type II secretion system inner membrane protein GspF [Myxococcota bacterium]